MSGYFKENLIFLRQEKGERQIETAAALGLTRSTYANYESGANEPKPAIIIKILEYFQVNFEELMLCNLKQKMGSGAKFGRNRELPISRPLNSPNTQIIPILDIAAAAGTGFYNSNAEAPVAYIQVPMEIVGRNNHIAIYNHGKSMEPTIRDGSLLFIRYQPSSDWSEIKNGQVIVVTNKEGATWVKRVENKLTQQGLLLLQSDNPDKSQYPDFKLLHSELHQVWLVDYLLTQPPSAPAPSPGEAH